ncbi:MAG TPA: hypothetical protein HPP76_07860 [Desulfuromonadales bacterium]|nr:hypothetical protein [Desulfuromonadales bacterium]
MEATRKIYRQLPDTLRMPENLKHRRVEVILLPLDTEKISHITSATTISPLARFAGAWEGELLVRENQGTYEVREDFK